MQSPSKGEYRYSTFGGLATNADPRDIAAGAMVLENMTLLVPGQLTSRQGFDQVVFENGVGTADSDTLSIYRFETPAAKYVLAQLDHGGVTAGRNPSL